MKEWILSIVSLVVLTSIIFMIIPNGRYSNFIKGIFSAITFFVIVSPLKNIANVQIDSYIFENNFDLQESYLSFALDKKCQQIEELCKESLISDDFEVDDVNVYYSLTNDYDFSIKKVEIILKKSVILSENTHIDINEKIKKIICEVLDAYGEEYTVSIYVGD